MKYIAPFVVPNAVTAMRSVQQALNKEPNNFNSYPHDFALYQVGEFDDDRGIVQSMEPRFLEELANLMPGQGGKEKQ